MFYYLYDLERMYCYCFCFVVICLLNIRVYKLDGFNLMPPSISMSRRLMNIQKESALRVKQTSDDVQCQQVSFNHYVSTITMKYFNTLIFLYFLDYFWILDAVKQNLTVSYKNEEMSLIMPDVLFSN